LYTIIAEHEDFLVVNKQPEVSMHLENQNSNDIGLIQRLRLDFNTPHIYPVHRLDKPTSGLLLCAKTSEANSQLSQLFQNRKVEKYYLAISDQKPKKKQGLIAGDMERTRKGNWKLSKTNSKPAVTQFFSESLGEGKRLFILKPHTGKTHQLRVALKSLGSPIMGDRRYAPAKDSVERMHLHAYYLQFHYQGKDFSFQSLPYGGAFTKNVLERIQELFNEPGLLSWPKLPNSLSAMTQLTHSQSDDALMDLEKRSEQKNKRVHGNDTALLEAIQCIIDIAEEPLSEYQLIQILNQQGWSLSTNAADSLQLFTSHFLVFNSLYRLQLDYWLHEKRYLEVSALMIFLHEKVEKNASIESDSAWLAHYTNSAALRDYYLDASQLENATEYSVNKL